MSGPNSQTISKWNKPKDQKTSRVIEQRYKRCTKKTLEKRAGMKKATMTNKTQDYIQTTDKVREQVQLIREGQTNRCN